MATTKPTFAKMKLAKNNEVKTITFANQEIEIKQYLPVEDKLKLIANVLNNSADENNFANPVKVDLFGTLEILYMYTNISFTDKQKENPADLFDICLSSGLVQAVINAIPADEYADIISWIDGCIDGFYQYKHSALGIMEAIAMDYSSLSFDASDIQNKIADPDNLTLLKDILTKLG